jgi:hypothetical protein
MRFGSRFVIVAAAAALVAGIASARPQAAATSASAATVTSSATGAPATNSPAAPVGSTAAGAVRKAAPSATARRFTIDGNNSCDIGTYPAATLLLPYFEVDVDTPVNEALNTIFSVVNTVRTPQIARITIWTDEGYPAAWFNIFLTGYDVQSISMYDVVARGLLPSTGSGETRGAMSAPSTTNAHFVNLQSCASPSSSALTESSKKSLQQLLTTGEKEGAVTAQCSAGTRHRNAQGYVTIDVVNSCSNVSPTDAAYYAKVLLFDNVLTGDYARINPHSETGNYAGANPLVHIKAIPEGGAAGTGTTPLPYTFYDRYTPSAARRVDRRQPLPSTFAARFIEGGTGQFNTDFAIWREGATSGSACVSGNGNLPVSSLVRFDEHENPSTAAATQSASAAGLPLAIAARTTSTMFPPLTGGDVAGWFYLNLDNQAALTRTNPYSAVRQSQNWVIVQLSADGRYAVDYNATSLTNGCFINPVSQIETVAHPPRKEDDEESTK